MRLSKQGRKAKTKYPWLILPWTVWCLSIMAVIMVVLFPLLIFLVFITPTEKKADLHWITKLLSRLCLFFFRIKIVNHGKEAVGEVDQAIYIFNHHSNLDPWVSAVLVDAKFLAKEEILSYPILGYAVKHIYVTVNRKSVADRQRSMRNMEAALARGESLIIYPEGTRYNGDDYIGAFHKGAFALSIKTQVPIVVITGANVSELVPPDKVRVYPGTIHCYWDGPYLPPENTQNQLAVFKAQCHERMTERMKTHYSTS